MANERGISTSKHIGPDYPYYLFANLLPYAVPYMNTSVIATVKSVPSNKSTVAHFRRVERLETDPIPLSEGVTPDATRVVITEVTATLVEYGRYIEYTDVVDDTDSEVIVNEFAPVLGDDLASTIELINAVELCSGTNVVYSNGTVRSAVNTPITKGTINSAVRFLESNFAKKVTSVNNAANLFNTSPIAPAFVAFCNSDVRQDIEAIEGFVPVEKYASQKLIHPTEIGSVGQVRFLMNNFMTVAKDGGGAKGSMVSTSGANADVYCIPVVAQNAFATIDHTKYGSGRMYHVAVSEANNSDPLAQRGTVGYKTWHAAKILNDDFIVRLEVAVTA